MHGQFVWPAEVEAAVNDLTLEVEADKASPAAPASQAEEEPRPDVALQPGSQEPAAASSPPDLPMQAQVHILSACASEPRSACTGLVVTGCIQYFSVDDWQSFGKVIKLHQATSS